MAEAMRHSDHATILYLFQLAVPSSWLADYRLNIHCSQGYRPLAASKRFYVKFMTRPITTLDPVAVSIYHEYRLFCNLATHYLTMIKFGTRLWHIIGNPMMRKRRTFYLRKGVHL